MKGLKMVNYILYSRKAFCLFSLLVAIDHHLSVKKVTEKVSASEYVARTNIVS